MTGERQPTNAAASPAEARSAPVAVLQVLALLALTAWAFWPELVECGHGLFGSGDWAHGLVAPALIFLLAHRRRRELARTLTRGSTWGVVLLVLGFGLLASNLWPFQFGYLRDVALVPVCAGAILAACGWRVLKLCLPMLLLVLLSIPLGARHHATLIIRPEAYTIATARHVLDRLPGVTIKQSGPDLDYSCHGRRGTVALGEARRGASLVVTYVVLGVFVTFAQRRALWQVTLLAAAAVPIALLCNLVRLVTWGVIAVYTNPDPVSGWPRAGAAVASLLLAYGLFVLVSWLLTYLVVEVEEEGGAAGKDLSTMEA